MFKFVIVLVISALVCDAAVLKDSCSTPNIKEGICVKLQDCPPTSAMSNDFETLMTLDRLNYLISSYCGYAENSAKVCCPVEEVTITKTDETTSSIQNTAAQTSEETTTSLQTKEETTSSNEIR